MNLEVFTGLLSLLATTISVFAFIETRKANRHSARLSEQEIELVRHQLSRMREEKLEEKKANVSAAMYSDGKGRRVKVFNKGPAEARNVRLVLDEQNHLVIENAIESKFPMTRMERGQSVDFAARYHMNSPSKETLPIRWDDPTGTDRENRVEITV